jgi:hypothetical protein
MGKKPLIGMVGFFGLSLALTGCSETCCLTRENGPPWRNNLARNSLKDQGWKDAPKADDHSVAVSATDPNKYRSPAAGAGNKLSPMDTDNRLGNEVPVSPYRSPSVSAAPTDPNPGASAPVVNNPKMALPDDGLKNPPVAPVSGPVIRDYPTSAKTPQALEEPPVPATRSLPALKGVSNESVVPPPPPPVSVDPSLSVPPPPLPVGVTPPGSTLPESATPPSSDPAPALTVPAAPGAPPVPPPPAPPPGM